MDVGAREQIIARIRQVAEEGTAVLCVTNDYDELGALCDRVLVFWGGRVTSELGGGELTKEGIARACHRVAPGAADPVGDTAPFRRFALPIAWVVVIVIFGALAPDTFLTAANFDSILASQAVLVVVTLALLLPLTAGDYDLSVASVVGLSANLIAILNVNHGCPIGVAILIALAAGRWSACSTGRSSCWCRSTASSSRSALSMIAGIVLWITESNTISGISNDWSTP